MAWPGYIDDDGTGTTGTILDKAFFDQIKGYVDTGVVTIANGGSNVFDVIFPYVRPWQYVRVNPTSAEITLQALTAANNGCFALIENVGTQVCWMQQNSGTASWHLNRVTSGKTPIAPGGSALYVYDTPTTYWRLAQHDQGRAIRLPYSAANFSVNTGSWSVPSGSVVAYDYYLRGTVLTVVVVLESTTVAGSPSTFSLKGWPFQFAGNVSAPLMFYQGTFQAARAQPPAAAGWTQLNASRMDGAVVGDSSVFQVHLSGAFPVT